MGRGPLVAVRKFIARRKNVSPARFVKLAAWELTEALRDRARGRPKPRDLAVEVTAEVDAREGRVALTFRPTGVPATFVTVYRRELGETSHASWGPPLAELKGDATTFVDTRATPGSLVEYGILRRHAQPPWRSTGRIAVALDPPLRDARGKLLLVVDGTYEAELAAELTRLVEDLVGDGWLVERLSVSRRDAPSAVKARIVEVWQRDPSLRSVLLFGHVPVPYSGDCAPDGHEVPVERSPGHRGAWPADVFYADMVGTWTDESVDTHQNPYPPPRVANENVPGDGKLDQSEVPCREVLLEVGRVDLSQLPAFLKLGEKELLRRYLDKDHRYRHGELTFEPRALIDDNFGYVMAPKHRERLLGKAFSTGAFRSFSAFFGPERVVEGDFFAALESESYLFAHASGAGQYGACSGVGTTEDFRRFDPKCPFIFLLGSYFGDWDNADNFLRAPLATSSGLVSGWCGIPDWSLHTLAVGETFGYALRHTQNVEGWDEDRRNTVRLGGSIHVALMGDPTLGIHVLKPPSAARATRLATGAVEIVFRPSSGPALGHHVYRAQARLGPYARLTDAPIGGERWVDEAPADGAVFYLVRAIGRVTSPSGSYQRASQGAFATLQT
jgi:hypothetical protein